jgi:hypothetical protein
MCGEGSCEAGRRKNLAKTDILEVLKPFLKVSENVKTM